MLATWLIRQYLSDIKSFVLDIFPDSLLARNEKFKDRHRGDRCFILGSGHSIREQDLTRLAGHIVMTQNHFHAHEDILIINPAYHVNVPKYQPQEFDDDWIAWLRSMDERLPAQTTLFFGKNTKYLVDRLGLFQDRVFYIQSGYTATLRSRPPVDLTRRIMTVPTVLTECLAIAIYMGFREIVLLGFDLDQICRMHDRDRVRFYGHSPITANKSEADAERDLALSGGDWINMWIIWHQCNLLKEEARRRGITIINATRGGLLNMFERRSFEEVV